MKAPFTKLLEPTLQKRVTLTLIGFAAVFSITLWLLNQWLFDFFQTAVLKATLEKELIEFVAKKSSVNSSQIHIYVSRAEDASPDPIPAPFKELTPGIYDEVEVGDKEYSVLVRDTGKERLVIVYDASHIDQKEQLFNIIVIICMLLFGLFVILASLWLGRRLAMPVKQLADKISGLDPAVRGARLPPGRHDATETVVITDAVNGFLQRLDGFVQREQEFTAHASHELRTPIGVIVGAADVLQTLPGLPATAKRPLARIRRASQAMTETISTLLYLARELAHADACNPPWRLDRLLPDIVEDHRHLLVRDKQLTLEIIRNEATELTAPQRVVTIAIANLLRNAVQHANAGRISVELVAGCLTIADTGRGIAAQDLIRVFERYVRGDTGESEGKGLGLYIIQQLCDRFGWAIKIDSQLAVGTRVRLDFFPQRKEAVLPGV